MIPYTTKQIEHQMDAMYSEIDHLSSVIEQAQEDLTIMENALKEFKRRYPHPNDKGGTGKYGAWTFDDTLADVRNVRLANERRRNKY